MASKNKRLEAAKAKLSTIVAETPVVSSNHEPEREDASVVAKIIAEVLAAEEIEAAQFDAALAADAAEENVVPVPPPAVQAAAPAAEAVVIRKHRYDPSHHIVVLSDKNPKKFPSAGYDRFAVYRTGMTVKEYMDDRRVGKFAAADLRWDLDRKFIKVVPSSEIASYMPPALPLAAE
jgi:hypothetical protein